MQWKTKNISTVISYVLNQTVMSRTSRKHTILTYTVLKQTNKQQQQQIHDVMPPVITKEVKDVEHSNFPFGQA